jgi:hypothetical protein
MRAKGFGAGVTMYLAGLCTSQFGNLIKLSNKIPVEKRFERFVMHYINPEMALS